MTLTISPQQAILVAQITGNGSGQTGHWQMGGADLGVMWLNPDTNVTFHAFGDNFKTVQEPSPFSGPVGSDWKPNALGRSTFVDFRGGVTWNNFNVDSNGDRTPILPLLSGEDGCVPTGGIHVNGTDYLSYVVYSAGHTDQSQTNAGGTAQSTDGGKSWQRNFNCFWNQNAQLTDPFQQSAFAYDWVHGGQYVYRFTTQSSRAGDIHLLRCPTTGVANKSTYQYWTGSAWVSDETKVGILIPGPAGEMSARYDDLLNVWYVMYHDDNAGYTVFQYAPSPTGPWSAKLNIFPDTARQPYGIYAPEIHPQSSGTSLFFCGSDWNTYETYLFYSKLDVSC